MKYFRNTSGEILHLIYNVFDQDNSRVELCEIHRALQVSIILVDEHQHDPKLVKPHTHTAVTRETSESIEAWIVMSGSGMVLLLDEQGAFIDMICLRTGDILITFKGGHALKTDSILMIECKNGPFVDTKQPVDNHVF